MTTIIRAFDFGTRGNRQHLHAIGELLRSMLTTSARGLQAGRGTRETMDALALDAATACAYVEAVCEQYGQFPNAVIRPDVRGPYAGWNWGAYRLMDAAAYSGPVGSPSPDETAPRPTTALVERRRRAEGSDVPTAEVHQFKWTPQEILSITPGTFSLVVSKGAQGFEIALGYTDEVVSFDSDVSFSVPGYATGLEGEFDASHDDCVVWGQKQASKRLEQLVTTLNAEIPPANPVQWSQNSELHDVYHRGGFAFRMSRVGNRVSLAIDREGKPVTPRKVLAEAQRIVE